MPYNRPSASVYVTNTSAGVYLHGAPVLQSNEVGVAVKQKATRWSDGLTVQNQIQIGEQFLLIIAGVVQVADGGAGFIDGDPVYITAANVLTKTATANTKFGRCVEVVGDGRGVPVGMVRINLDLRSSF